jgi:hypothetical protein
MKQKLFIVVCLSLLLGGGFFLAKSRLEKGPEEKRAKSSVPILEPMAIGEDGEGEEQEGHVDERNDWFFYQRAYPFGSIPEDARRKAWESIGKGKVQPASVPASLTGWSPIGPSPTHSAFPGNWGLTSGRIKQQPDSAWQCNRRHLSFY